MENMRTIVLEDNIEYAIIKEITIDGILYTLLANINDEKDICFRKTITEDNEEYFIGLDDEKELQKVLTYFSKDILENENSEN